MLEAYDAILKRKEGVHPTATVDDHAVVGEGCYIGPGVVVEHGAVIGDRVELHAHVHVSRDARIGNDSVLHSGVRVPTVRGGTFLHASSGGRGGSDGFGFAPKDDGSYAKVPQTGNVIVEDHCDIGAHTTIDRATLGSTVLKRGASWTTSFRLPTTW